MRKSLFDNWKYLLIFLVVCNFNGISACRKSREVYIHFPR